MYPKIALASSILVFQRCRLSRSVCMRPAERFDHGIVVGVADAAERGQQAGFAGSFGEGPGRELGAVISVDDAASGIAESMAMPSALVARSARWAKSMAQPTTLRDQASSTRQQYSLPSRVGCSVMSVTHSWFGPSRRKSRRTRSVTVIRRLIRLPRGWAARPASPARRIRQAHGVAPDGDAQAQDALGVDPRRAVGSP
jgi:hypothetical protein